MRNIQKFMKIFPKHEIFKKFVLFIFILFFNLLIIKIFNLLLINNIHNEKFPEKILKNIKFIKMVLQI